MSEHANRPSTAARNASPELRAQLDELLAAFDEIDPFGRERRRQERDAGHMETTP